MSTSRKLTATVVKFVHCDWGLILAICNCRLYIIQLSVTYEVEWPRGGGGDSAPNGQKDCPCEKLKSGQKGGGGRR